MNLWAFPMGTFLWDTLWECYHGAVAKLKLGSSGL